MKWYLMTMLLTGLALLPARGTTAAAADAVMGTRLAPGHVIFYDATPLTQLDLHNDQQRRRYYDETFLLTSLQALVNRKQPRLFIRYNQEPDDFWWQRLTEDQAWLAEAQVARPATLTELLRELAPAARGFVLWDERVPATSNVAATIAGVEDLLVVRFDATTDSLHQQLLREFPALHEKRRLLQPTGEPLFTGTGMIPDTKLPSTGSAKNDAYRWMIEHYVKAGKTNPLLLGYYLDGFWLRRWQVAAPPNHTLNNLDYVMANRGAIFDLNVWADEACIDDPQQQPGTDLETLQQLLRACYDRTDGQTMIHATGFVPWCYKYTNAIWNGESAGGNHGPVETEWHYAEVATSYNAYMEPDALAYSSFVNASFYQHYPLPEVIPQSPAPTQEQLIRTGVLDATGALRPLNYYAHYQGDYDCAAWIYWNIPKFWADPARGTLPLSWAINPNLALRFPFGMHWLRAEARPGEVFIAGEAAGYVFQRNLQEPRPYSGLPDGTEAWRRHNAKFYRQWDLDITGFNIDGATHPMDDRMLAAYATFSRGGLGFQFAPRGQGVFDGMPMLQYLGDLPPGTQSHPDGLANDGPHDFEIAARAIASHCIAGQPNFLYFRSILRGPSFYAGTDARLKEIAPAPTMLVDARTLFWLVREYETHRDRYAVTADHTTTAPATVGAP